MRRRPLVATVGSLLLALAALAGVGASSAAAATAPGVTAKTITIGLITSITGPAAPDDTGVVPAAKARIALQNAQGGIDGRKIKLIVLDDQTNPATNQLDANILLSRGVFGVIEESALTFGGYKVLQKAGVPVTGGGYDGPEWGQLPNTNMFSIDGSFDPQDPQSSGIARFVKAHGGTECGSLGLGQVPSSAAAATGFIFSCEAVGLKKAYLDTSLPLTNISVAPLALEMRTAGVNALYLPLGASTNFQLITALKQAGVKLAVAITGSGYSQDVLNDPSVVQDGQGVWFGTPGIPVELHTPATQAFQAALAKYAHFKGVPGFDYYQGWGAADLMLTGLKLAGKDPTRAGFIDALHKDTDYTSGGLQLPVNLSLKAFGKTASPLCLYLVKLQGHAFVDPTKVCGPILPNSDQLPSA